MRRQFAISLLNAGASPVYCNDMTTFLSLFEFGALGFWLLMLLTSIVFITALETQRFVFATVVSLGLLAGYWPTLAKQNWTAGNITAAAGAYILVGLIWSVFRWYRQVTKAVAEYNDEKISDYDLIAKTKVGRNKAEITAWIGYWPWSLVWNLTGDILTGLFDAFKNVYQNIANSALKNIKRQD
jgi:hypothetical protein